jgi:SAM-dependent methyltransferase
MCSDHLHKYTSKANGTSGSLYEDFHSPRSVKDWERTSAGKFAAWSRLIEYLPKGIFLDIGCGDGSITQRIAELAGGQSLAMDIAVGAFRGASGLKTQYVICDTSQVIPLSNDSIDHIFCSDLIEHLVDVDVFLDELYRILKPGGYCVLSTPNLGWLPNRLLLLLGLHPFWVELSYRYEISGFFAEKRKFPAGHIHVFTLRALLVLLQLHGLEIEKVLGARMIEKKTLRRWGFPKWVRIFSLLDRFCELRPSWSAEIVVKFRKPKDH